MRTQFEPRAEGGPRQTNAKRLPGGRLSRLAQFINPTPSAIRICWTVALGQYQDDEDSVCILGEAPGNHSVY